MAEGFQAKFDVLAVYALHKSLRVFGGFYTSNSCLLKPFLGFLFGLSWLETGEMGRRAGREGHEADMPSWF